jgi:hypothetical protein
MILGELRFSIVFAFNLGAIQSLEKNSNKINEEKYKIVESFKKIWITLMTGETEK